MNREIIEKYIIELCYKKASSDHPHLDIKNLIINTLNILGDNVDVVYYFNLTSRMDPKVKMEIKTSCNFTKKDFIPYLRDRRLDNLLS